MHLEEIVIEELGLKILEEWDISVSSLSLEQVFLGIEPLEKIKRRKLHLRGLTEKK